MDDFDSQSFLQLAPTIPDRAGLGLTLPSTSLAPDQGQSLQSATGQDPTPPQDLAAAANAFQPRAFLLAAPNQPAPPAVQPSAPAGSAQPLNDASSIDSRSLIQALQQVPDGAASGLTGPFNNASLDQGLGSTSDGLTASAPTPPEDFDTANAFRPQPLFPAAQNLSGTANDGQVQPTQAPAPTSTAAPAASAPVAPTSKPSSDNWLQNAYKGAQAAALRTYYNTVTGYYLSPLKSLLAAQQKVAQSQKLLSDFDATFGSLTDPKGELARQRNRLAGNLAAAQSELQQIHQPGDPDAAEYARKALDAAKAAQEASGIAGLSPADAQRLPARIAGGVTSGGIVMGEAAVPDVGPALAIGQSALAARGEGFARAAQEGKSLPEAIKQGDSSAAWAAATAPLALLANKNIAGPLGDWLKQRAVGPITSYLGQMGAQAGANEATNSILRGLQAYAQAPEGQKLAAVREAIKPTVESVAQSLGFGAVGALRPSPESRKSAAPPEERPSTPAKPPENPPPTETPRVSNNEPVAPAPASPHPYAPVPERTPGSSSESTGLDSAKPAPGPLDNGPQPGTSERPQASNNNPVAPASGGEHPYAPAPGGTVGTSPDTTGLDPARRSPGLSEYRLQPDPSEAPRVSNNESAAPAPASPHQYAPVPDRSPGPPSDFIGPNPTNPVPGPSEYSPQPSPSESPRLSGQGNISAPKGSDRGSKDEAHPYAPVPDPSGPPPAAPTGTNVQPPTQLQLGLSGYGPRPDRQLTSQSDANQEGSTPRDYAPLSPSDAHSGPFGYGPQRSSSDSSKPSPKLRQGELFGPSDLPGDEAPVRKPSDPAKGLSVSSRKNSRPGNTTRLGVPRNNPQDWRDTRDLWDSLGYKEILSEENRKRIDSDKRPKVDDAWIRVFPEDAGLLGERITPHHVLGLPLTIPLPKSRHTESHMPGGYKWNPGSVGSALPVFPKLP